MIVLSYNLICESSNFVHVFLLSIEKKMLNVITVEDELRNAVFFALPVNVYFFRYKGVMGPLCSMLFGVLQWSYLT